MSPRTTSTRSKRRPSASATAAAAALALSGSSSPAAVNAFALLPGASPARSFAPPSTLFAASGESPSNDAAVASRRDVLQRSLGIFAAGLAFAGNAQPASASYSAYIAREQDWDNRKKTGGKFGLRIEPLGRDWMEFNRRYKVPRSFFFRNRMLTLI